MARWPAVTLVMQLTKCPSHNALYQYSNFHIFNEYCNQFPAYLPSGTKYPLKLSLNGIPEQRLLSDILFNADSHMSSRQ